jgi:hypothetical protein
VLFDARPTFFNAAHSAQDRNIVRMGADIFERLRVASLERNLGTVIFFDSFLEIVSAIFMPNDRKFAPSGTSGHSNAGDLLADSRPS